MALTKQADYSLGKPQAHHRMGFFTPAVCSMLQCNYFGVYRMDIDLDKLDLDIDEAALAEKIEAKLQADEVEIEAINDCESGACAI